MFEKALIVLQLFSLHREHNFALKTEQNAHALCMYASLCYTSARCLDYSNRCAWGDPSNPFPGLYDSWVTVGTIKRYIFLTSINTLRKSNEFQSLLNHVL